MSVEKYTLEKCVGKGTFGDVYMAINKVNKSKVAIKVIDVEESTEDLKTIVQEIQFLSTLRSPYITQYLETFVNGTGMWIVMEYCGGGSCADLLKCHGKLNEQITAFIIRDVLRGLEYLHSQKKVHRDIKSANILLTEDGQIKLGDFGVSGEITLTQIKRKTVVGTPFWMAPEVITGQTTGYNEKADIWSTGITTIELVTGAPPFSDKDPMKIIFEIPKRDAPKLEGINYSENIKDFIRYCLEKKPRKRPNASILLRHKFITSVKREKYTSLVPYIEKKDKFFKKHNLIRIPRQQINFEPGEEPLVQWSFTTRRPSPMQQTLVDMYTFFNDDPLDIPASLIPLGSSEPVSPVNQVGPITPTSLLATPSTQLSEEPIVSAPLESPWDEYLAGKLAEQYKEEQNQIISNLQEPTPNPEIVTITDYKSLFILCLERVKARGETEATKIAIDNLIQMFTEFEANQPGLSETLLEEIFRFKYLAGN